MRKLLRFIEKAMKLFQQRKLEAEYLASAEESSGLAADFEGTISDGLNDE